MRRELRSLVVVLAVVAGCPSPSTHDADVEADGDQPDGGDAVDADAWDGADQPLDDGDRSDAEADIPEEAEGWDFGADLWDPERDCDAAVEDPPAWVAPSCGDDCRQVAFAAQPWGPFAVSERWLAYRSRYRTWVIELESADESVLFCHPYFVGSYGLDVDGDIAVSAVGTDFMVGEVHVDYASVWATDLSTGRHWPVHARAKPFPAEMTDIIEARLSGHQAAFVLYDVTQLGPTSWTQRGNIYVTDTASGVLSPVMEAARPCCFGWPDIGGDWVVYSTTNAVLAYNLETGTTIGPDIPGDQYWPRTDGVNVIWLDHRNYPGGYMSGGSWDIYSYNFVAETELRITTESTPAAEDAAPDMLGDVVVWSDHRNATPEEPHHTDLFLYRYSTGREQQLTFASGAARWPRVTNTAVYFVWVPDPEPDPDTAERAICEQILPPP